MSRRRRDLLAKVERIDWGKLEQPLPIDDLWNIIDEAFEVEVFYHRGKKIGRFKLKDLKVKLL